MRHWYPVRIGIPVQSKQEPAFKQDRNQCPDKNGLSVHFHRNSQGQTELWENKLRLQRYAAIRQRIDINCVLPHLDRSETEQYIKSHLSYAGSNRDIFSDKALDEIFRVTAGIPRMINRICEKSLMYSFQQQKRIIDDYMVKYVAEHEMLV